MSDVRLDVNIYGDGPPILEVVGEDDGFVIASEDMCEVFDAKVEEVMYRGRREEVRRFAAELLTLGERYMKKTDGK